MKTQAASSIQPRKEETVEEVIEETPAQAPTQITCVHNDSVAPVDCKTNHHLHDSQASADKTLAAGGILSRKEERIEEVIAETSVLAPTEITCRLNHPAPSADWKTDHGFRGSCRSVMKMQAASYIQPRREETVEVVEETSALVPTQVTCVRNDPVPTNGKTDHGFYGSNASVMKTETPSRNNPASAASLLGSRDTDHICNVLVPSTVNAVHSSPYNATAQQHLNYSSFDMKETGQPSVGMGYPQQTLTDRFSDHVHNMLMPFTVNAAVNNVPALQNLSYNSFDARESVQLPFGTVDPQQALSTGRLGESAAYNYFVGIFGEHFVKWVNETNETGLPYDLVVAGNEYIEVKATRSVTKDWFHISLREWQFALEKGELFSIAHVVLSPHNAAKVTLYRNPARLCCLGKLQLALIVPK
ncbi:protein NO VEIN-LIKE [Capsicum galapagoense]